MTRTVRFFLQNLEKRQTLIKSLATLKTENSRLKELVSSKSQQVEQMASQLESVSTAKQSLQDLITALFAKIDKITDTRQSVHAVLECQREKANDTLKTLQRLTEQLHEGEKEKGTRSGL